MYYDLFNRVTDAIEELKAAQQATKEFYLAYGEDGDADDETDKKRLTRALAPDAF